MRNPLHLIVVGSVAVWCLGCGVTDVTSSRAIDRTGIVGKLYETRVSLFLDPELLLLESEIASDSAVRLQPEVRLEVIGVKKLNRWTWQRYDATVRIVDGSHSGSLVDAPFILERTIAGIPAAGPIGVLDPPRALISTIDDPLSALESPEWSVRFAAAERLRSEGFEGRISSEHAIRLFTGEPDPDVRLRLMSALRADTSDSISALLHMLVDEPTLLIREQAQLIDLIATSSAEVVPELERTFSTIEADDLIGFQSLLDISVRSGSRASALAPEIRAASERVGYPKTELAARFVAIDSEAAVDLAIELLESHRRWQRMHALDILRQVGPTAIRALPLIRRVASEDPSSKVRAAAVETAIELSRYSDPTSPSM